MSKYSNKLNQRERSALKVLIGAIESHPESDDPDLKMSAKTLNEYLDNPSDWLRSIAKMAFDDIDPAVRGAIKDNSIEIAKATSSLQDSPQPPESDTINIQPRTKKEAPSHSSAFLAVLNRR